EHAEVPHAVEHGRVEPRSAGGTCVASPASFRSPPRVMPMRQYHPLVLACVPLMLLGVLPACRPRATPPPNPGATSGGGQLMSERDEQRLEALAATRAKERDAGGYRIGPDDLRQIRVPDLLTTEDDRPA